MRPPSCFRKTAYHHVLVIISLGILLAFVLSYDSNMLSQYLPSSSEEHTSSSCSSCKVAQQQDLPPPPSQQLQHNALNFVLERQQAFEKLGLAWRYQGLGYFYLQHNIILGGEILTHHHDDPQIVAVGTMNSVHIYNVHPNNTNSNTTNNINVHCHHFNVWVRIRGPEIIAGIAEAVNVSSRDSSFGQQDYCYWTYDFKVHTQGKYFVDAKILTYTPTPHGRQGELTSQQLQQCQNRKFKNVTGPQDLIEMFPVNSGFKGFKLYFPDLSCCEFCTRLAPWCVYWATPAFLIEKPAFNNNGCQFFFQPNTPRGIIPKSHLLSTKPPDGNKAQNAVLWNQTIGLLSAKGPTTTAQFQFSHGTSHDQLPTHNYIGCGWSSWYTLDFPCLSRNLDDKVYFDTNHFIAVIPVEKTVVKIQDNKEDPHSSSTLTRRRQLCSLETEISSSETLFSSNNGGGRWIQKDWPDSTICPNDMKIDKKYSSMFDIIKFDPMYPHCWHRDDFRNVGKRCIEANCRFISKQSAYISPLKNASSWYGVWKHDSGCSYLEFTTTQLQHCITTRNIRNITASGESIARFLNQYLSQRLDKVKFYTGRGSRGRSIVLDTLALLHYAQRSDESVREMVASISTNNDDSTSWKLWSTPNGVTEERYFVSSPFVSSERETYVYANRVDRLNNIAQEILLKKGYRILNYFDMSKSFTYDTSTQMDGLHIIGPPMKMIITKLFHYLCKDVVVGTIV